MTGKFKKNTILLITFVLLLIPLIITGCDNDNNNNDNEVAEVDEEVAVESLLIDELVYENRHVSNIDMELFWKFSEDEHSLYMMLKSPGSGWLAVGFEPSTRMADAEIIIAGFDEDDNFLLEEHFGTSATSHELIEETYIKESSGERNDENSIAEFIIPLGEDSRYDLEPGTEYEIILSYHSSSDNFIQRHSQRTTIELEL